MDGFDINVGGGYSLNYDLILKQKDLMSVTKLLVHRMMENPYIVVGEYISELSDMDLALLQDCVEAEDYKDIILMSEMLATAEGCAQAADFAEFNERTNSLVSFLTLESLGRKGLVKVHHQNLSFHPDSRDKVVVEKIEGLDYNKFLNGE